MSIERIIPLVTTARTKSWHELQRTLPITRLNRVRALCGRSGRLRMTFSHGAGSIAVAQFGYVGALVLVHNLYSCDTCLNVSCSRIQVFKCTTQDLSIFCGGIPRRNPSRSNVWYSHAARFTWTESRQCAPVIDRCVFSNLL